ncbi:hypothetical protein [Fundicoccus culcitae]|uniref:V-type proton ATPase subunit E n=1 Tax=Fundicoccus culcitae TaxID=2969821 RepID=A0ABY5P5E2_9LACT|nr:hypothetical protein [Fundicoccus culcitae]UUX33962.1 hypothetical protein NRE15_13930 [Fundicoccus culcitae]
MSELSRLEESVIRQAHKKGQLKLEQAEAEAQKQFKKDQREFNDEFAYEEELALEALKHKYEHQIQQVENRRRQSSLIGKQKLIIGMFDQAVEEMNQWPKETHLKFINQVLELYHDNYLRIQFGEYTLKHLEDQDLETLKKDFNKIKINSHPIDKQGGFIISIGRVDYNYIYAKLVEATRHDLSAEIAKRVFSET